MSNLLVMLIRQIGSITPNYEARLYTVIRGCIMLNIIQSNTLGK